MDQWRHQQMNIKLARRALSRRMKFRGFNISIETDKGELRHWYDPHNKEHGTTKMKYPYGYIRRTEGLDGDHVDCYIGPNQRAPYVYLVDQMKAPDFSELDEQKCMLGFLSMDAAKKAYLAHYNNDRFLGSMTKMRWEDFEKKVKKTFDKPAKIASMPMNHVQTAYRLGQQHARSVFEKDAKAGAGRRLLDWMSRKLTSGGRQATKIENYLADPLIKKTTAHTGTGSRAEMLRGIKATGGKNRQQVYEEMMRNKSQMTPRRARQTGSQQAATDLGVQQPRVFATGEVSSITGAQPLSRAPKTPAPTPVPQAAAPATPTATKPTNWGKWALPAAGVGALGLGVGGYQLGKHQNKGWLYQ